MADGVTEPDNLFDVYTYPAWLVHSYRFAELSWGPLREEYNKLTKRHAAILPFISTLARPTTVIATRS